MFRSEYPRPQLVRDAWMCLNGSWEFEFDDASNGLAEKWYSPNKKLSKVIQVPFCFESELSGIADKRIHEKVCYKKKFILPDEFQGKQILLHFGAVDYFCKVFVNGELAGEHCGGHVGFSVNITNYLSEKEQDITVYVYDPCTEDVPRGKQFWKKDAEGIWYTRTTGIWQTVWMEAVSATHINSIRFTPNVDEGNVKIETDIACPESASLKIQMYFQEKLLGSYTIELQGQKAECVLDVFQKQVFNSEAHGYGMCWWPENPNLIDVMFTVCKDDQVVDKVTSYFGMRKIHTENGMIFLNNRPYYMKLVLDQGYWKGGLMTAPDDKDFITDIELAKKMGFNGCRKHQKVEDPRFLYWADKMGYLVWGEMAASCSYSSLAATRLVNEWEEIIERDYNHPSIVAWVPLNESWGVSQIDKNVCQQHHSMTLYHLIKSLDLTRLVINNDGWEMTKSDICAIHNYAHGTDEKQYQYFVETLKSKDLLLKNMSAGRHIYAGAFQYEGEPILLTECGGIAYVCNAGKGWGYTVAQNEEEFLEQYEKVISAILNSDVIYGFCYTQLTDVEQEINGLLTDDRKPKCDVENICRINNEWRHNMAWLD